MNFRFNPKSRDLYYGDKRVNLAITEARLFGLLVRRGGQYMSRSELADVIDPEGRLQDAPNNVSTYLCRLRGKIRAKGMPDCIQSLYSAGYRLAHKVELEEDDGRMVLDVPAARLLKRLIARCEGTRQEALANELRDAVF